MDTTKELLAIVASTLVATGVVRIGENLWEGVAVLLLGAGCFVGRGFYKKYLGKKEGKIVPAELLEKEEDVPNE